MGQQKIRVKFLFTDKRKILFIRGLYMTQIEFRFKPVNQGICDGFLLKRFSESPKSLCVQMKKNIYGENELDYIKFYFHQLKFLDSLGVLNRRTRLFNVLSGFDLFPGYFVDQMWTFDRRIDGTAIHNFFEDLCRAVNRMGVIDEPGKELLLADKLFKGCKITHERANVLEQGFFDILNRFVRPFDVIFLRFTIGYLLGWGTDSCSVKRWVDELIEKVPVNTNFVVIDCKPKEPYLNFPEGLAAYMLKSRRFRNLFSDDYIKALDEINLKATSFTNQRYVRLNMDKMDISLLLGGSLAALRKVY